MGLQSRSLQYTTLLICLRIINAASKYTKKGWNGGREKGWMSEAWKYLLLMRMEDVWCLHTTSFPAVWMYPLCKLIHKSGGPEMINCSNLFCTKHRGKKNHAAWSPREGYKASCFPSVFSNNFFKEKLMTSDIYFCVKKKKWATMTKVNVCGEFSFVLNYLKMLK